MGTVTSTPMLRIRVDQKSPFKGVSHFRIAIEDLKLAENLLPQKVAHAELACVVFLDAPFPEEKFSEAFYYVDGVLNVDSSGEPTYKE